MRSKPPRLRAAMHWDHNSHYHDLLLRHVPRGARRALDVGCGQGRLARRLAARVERVEAIDADPRMIATARRWTPDRLGVDFTEATLAGYGLDPGRYDFVSALSSIHHMPFGESVDRLRAALAPCGVLAVCGLYREAHPLDSVAGAAALLPQVAIGAGLVAARAVTGVAVPGDPDTAMPMRDPRMSLPEIRAAAARHLPGSRVRRLLFWRYLLVYRAPARPTPGSQRVR